MITLILGTNFIRALVLDINGAPLSGAAVTVTMIKTYGAPIATVNNAAMNPVAGQATYNYEFVTPDNFSAPQGTLYAITISVVKVGQTRTRTFTASVDGN